MLILWPIMLNRDRREHHFKLKKPSCSWGLGLSTEEPSLVDST